LAVIPGCYCSKASGSDEINSALFWFPFGILEPSFDTRVRVPGTNDFRDPKDHSTFERYASSSCVTHTEPNPSCAFKLCSFTHDANTLPAEEFDGCWCCCCVPLGPGFFYSKATGPDSKTDTTYCWLLPFVPFAEERVRILKSNDFRKPPDPNAPKSGGPPEPEVIDRYTSTSCMPNSGRAYTQGSTRLS
jgi:hypothetical protein